MVRNPQKELQMGSRLSESPLRTVLLVESRSSWSGIELQVLRASASRQIELYSHLSVMREVVDMLQNEAVII